jgi:general secretion pathway protein M
MNGGAVAPIALPEGARGRALALALLLIAAAAGWACVAAPLLGWYQARAQALAEQRLLAAHMAAVAAGLPDLRTAVGRAAAERPVDALLAGDSDAVAAAALQSTLERIARGVGASVTSVTILPGEPAGAWRRIGLRLELHAPFAVIVRLLQAVMKGAPPMLIDGLSLIGPAYHAAGVPQTIDASFTVYAFRRGGSHVPLPDAREALAE